MYDIMTSHYYDKFRMISSWSMVCAMYYPSYIVELLVCKCIGSLWYSSWPFIQPCHDAIIALSRIKWKCLCSLQHGTISVEVALACNSIGTTALLHFGDAASTATCEVYAVCSAIV